MALGNESNPTKVVAPVVVKPENDSKKARPYLFTTRKEKNLSKLHPYLRLLPPDLNNRMISRNASTLS
jgi:hypothetical protein